MATSSLRHSHFDNKPICPPSSFPDSFKDFFQTLNEDDDGVDMLATMLEDKLIPRGKPGGGPQAARHDPEQQQHQLQRPFGRRGMSARHYPSRGTEAAAAAPHHRPHSQNQTLRPGEAAATPAVSPTVARRRSSSIAVTRAPPDLHRFLQAEQQRPWGHLNPNPQVAGGTAAAAAAAAAASNRCHLSPNPTATPSPMQSPAGCYSSRLHLSPGSSPGAREPTSPRTRYPPAAGNEYRTYRTRTSSMPVVPKHRPMLGEMRRAAALQCCDSSESEDVEYYRLRSFSITANGVFNLGDSLRSRRSRSISSVTSTGTSGSGGSRDRNHSWASQGSSCTGEAASSSSTSGSPVATYKVAMLGASSVGKTALTYQFTTSEYICAYDASLDEEYGQKTVSVMLDGQETELEIIDHPASEMSVESFCATYNVDVFVVVYSVVDRKSLKAAEETLLYLWKGDYMASRGVILVANKADLERKREVPMVVGRRLANSCGCKFIETSSGLDHNVDELLVGILAQVKLNPKRDRNQIHRKRRHKARIGSGRRILKHLLGLKRKTRSCENLFVL